VKATSALTPAPVKPLPLTITPATSTSISVTSTVKCNDHINLSDGEIGVYFVNEQHSDRHLTKCNCHIGDSNTHSFTGEYLKIFDFYFSVEISVLHFVSLSVCLVGFCCGYRNLFIAFFPRTYLALLVPLVQIQIKASWAT
jgi:hypothetical protein